jgi:hypothetical protein
LDAARARNELKETGTNRARKGEDEDSRFRNRPIGPARWLRRARKEALMMKSTSQVTLALFLLLAPLGAWAQDSTGTRDPAAPPSAEAAPPATTETPAAKPVEGQIVLQDMDTMLVSGLVGANVYSPGDEWIGDVNDLIVDTSGALKGVVIGVGGVMGIGEKEVAFEIAKLKFTPSEDRSTAKLVLDATKEELQASPNFKSAAIQIFEKAQDQPERQPDPTQPPPQPEPPGQQQ